MPWQHLYIQAISQTDPILIKLIGADFFEALIFVDQIILDQTSFDPNNQTFFGANLFLDLNSLEPDLFFGPSFF